MAQAIPDDSVQSTVDHLQTLVANLWYPSETDAPVEVVVWPTPPGEIGDAFPPGATVAEYPADQFFHPILSQAFWHSSQGHHLAQRYQALQAFLRDTLSDLRTYRAGQVEITLMVVGRHPSGQYIGVQTSLVET
ncbi:MAG: nuclease A inhibitor family protein [Leptolyngbya sp.]|nr:nuclease A inhibitor family protein [Leptolyngbya sp.]